MNAYIQWFHTFELTAIDDVLPPYVTWSKTGNYSASVFDVSLIRVESRHKSHMCEFASLLRSNPTTEHTSFIPCIIVWTSGRSSQDAYWLHQWYDLKFLSTKILEFTVEQTCRRRADFISISDLDLQDDCIVWYKRQWRRSWSKSCMFFSKTSSSWLIDDIETYRSRVVIWSRCSWTSEDESSYWKRKYFTWKIQRNWVMMKILKLPARLWLHNLSVIVDVISAEWFHYTVCAWFDTVLIQRVKSWENEFRKWNLTSSQIFLCCFIRDILVKIEVDRIWEKLVLRYPVTPHYDIVSAVRILLKESNCVLSEYSLNRTSTIDVQSWRRSASWVRSELQCSPPLIFSRENLIIISCVDFFLRPGAISHWRLTMMITIYQTFLSHFFQQINAKVSEMSRRRWDHWSVSDDPNVNDTRGWWA